MNTNRKFKHSAEHLDPAWYVGEGYLGEVVNGDKRIIVGCYGVMRIQVPDNDEPIRSTERLIKYGVTNDKELSDLNDKFADDDIWQNNAWFEVYEEGDSEGEIFHDLDEAFTYAEGLASGSV